MVGDGLPFFPYDAVQEASDNGCASISYTYTEPTIFFEFDRTIAMEARKKGLKNVFVTNGFMTRRALDDASCWLDAANVDVKAYSDEYYRETCKGRLKPVLDAIAYMKSIGIWVEATTLVVPGKNDSDEQLKAIADFLSETGADIPWHISRFHPDYRFDSHSPPPGNSEQGRANRARGGLEICLQGKHCRRQEHVLSGVRQNRSATHCDGAGKHQHGKREVSLLRRKNPWSLEINFRWESGCRKSATSPL